MDKHSITYNSEHSVIMANDIVRGKQDMTLQEARIIRLMITQIAMNDTGLYVYSCRIGELAEYLDLQRNKNIYAQIKEICDKLPTRVVKIGTGNPKQPWKTFNWVSCAEYDGNGTITISLSTAIEPYVLELNKWFTQYPLKNILNFSSFYAIRLYELLICKIGESRGKLDYVEYDISNLRAVFCCENKYATTAVFVLKTIAIAEREINDKSDIQVVHENIKDGRKIISLRFYVGDNPRKFIRGRTV